MKNSFNSLTTCNREFNQNPLDFIIAVENIKKADKDWFKLAQEVIAKYVKPEATSEINISGKDKKKTIEAFGKLQKTATKEECYHVFDDLVDIVVSCFLLLFW